MPERYPKPAIVTAGLFRDPHAVAPIETPAWWPNDKHLVLTFRALVLPAGQQEDTDE